MEAKDVIVVIVAVALAAVIGFLFIKMMQGFMSESGLIQGFLENILTSISDKAKALLQ